MGTGREWARSTRQCQQSRWKTYINPVFGRVPIDRITTADIRKWHRKLEARGLAPRYIVAIHLCLSAVLQGAVEDELIVRNPGPAAKLRRTPKTLPVALDRDETAAFIDAVAATTPRLAPYARFVAATGLRRAEAAGVTWDRIDLDTGTLTVDRQLDYTAPVQPPAWCPTKTAKTRRVLLTDTTVATLREHRRPLGRPTLGVGVHEQRSPVGQQSVSRRLAPRRRPSRRVGQSATGRCPRLARVAPHRRVTAPRGRCPTRRSCRDARPHPAQLLTTYAHVVDRSAADALIRAVLT